MANSVVAHRKQFVLSSGPFPAEPDWHSLAIADGFHFSHHPDLSVRIRKRDGRSLILFGHALAASATPSDDLAETLTGRFGWIDWPYLYPDASALFPIYYARTPAGPLITSSLSLAAKRTGVTTRQRSISRRGLNWTPTATPLGGMQKLLRDQRLHIPTARAEYIGRALRPRGSFEAARDDLAADLTAIAGAQKECSGTIYLALTAGLDSRTLLAALLAAEIPFECITQSFPGVKRNDVELARRICRHLGLKHQVIGPGERDERVSRAWREHSAETYSETDNFYLLPQDQYRFLQASDVLVRGGCFELGRRFYASVLNGLDFATATGPVLWSRFEAGPPDQPTIIAFDDWLEWRRQHDNGLDLVDAFYLDQRLGGWLSAVEHGLDMVPGISLPAANCGRILSALITPDQADRVSGRLQREVIRRLAPGLLKFPVNPVPISDRATRLAGRGAQFLRRRLKEALPPALVQRLQKHRS